MQLDFREAARLLGVDESTLQRWVRRGELPARLVNDQHRFDRVDLLEFAAARGIDMSPDAAGAGPPGSPPLPRLADAVRAGGVHRDVPGADKAEVLAGVVGRFPLPAGLDRDFLLQMLLAREQLGSTGLGQGIAIPHPRSPIVLRVTAPAVPVCYLARPVDFDALDGRPVHTLFALISPSVRVHLHLLSVIAVAARDPDVLARISARAGEDDLVPAIAHVEDTLAARRADP